MNYVDYTWVRVLQNALSFLDQSYSVCICAPGHAYEHNEDRTCPLTHQRAQMEKIWVWSKSWSAFWNAQIWVHGYLFIGPSHSSGWLWSFVCIWQFKQSSDLFWPNQPPSKFEHRWQINLNPFKAMVGWSLAWRIDRPKQKRADRKKNWNFPFFYFPYRLHHISGPTGLTKVVYLSKFVGFCKESNY